MYFMILSSKADDIDVTPVLQYALTYICKDDYGYQRDVKTGDIQIRLDQRFVSKVLAMLFTQRGVTVDAVIREGANLFGTTM